jgi:hypothetical protein
MIKGFYILFFVLFGSVNSKQQEERVSLINLIATPERFDGKAVIVSGFFSDKFENRRLYFDKISIQKQISENSTFLIFDSTVTPSSLKIYNNSIVELKGVFHKVAENNKNSFTHYLSKIYSIKMR